MEEKKHRLEKEFYEGEKTVSFTLCIKDRREVFLNDNLFNVFSDFLLESIKKFDVNAMIYLFMPDHAHIILMGESKNSDVIASMNLFKQKSGFWFYENKKSTRWQKDYYDHIIRNDKDLKKQIYYILNNPVRKGLVDNWKDYKFKGSTVYNFDEWVFPSWTYKV